MADVIPTEILNLLAQFPIFAIFYFMWRSQMDAHAQELTYYREQQRRTLEWMQRLFEVWSAEELKRRDIDMPDIKPRPVSGD